MFGFQYLKVPATTYVLQYRSGEVVRQGAGLSFWYFAPTCVISQVPISSVDVPFAFTEMTADFQEVTSQGTLTYRIVQPAQIAELLNYTVDTYGRYQSDDPTKLGERLIQVAHTGARVSIQSRGLRDVLVSSDQLVQAITAGLQGSATVTQLGVEVLEVSINSLRADPEMSKALQAEAREQLLKEADEAIYARRNTAVELERTIRENELNTEIAVAQKQRDVRETTMQTDISMEQQRADLVQARVENETKEAESRGAALRAILEPVRDLDWKMLLAMQGDARSDAIIASAFDQLAGNAEKIGQLNITPDLLERLITRRDYDEE